MGNRIFLTEVNSPKVIVACKKCGLERNPASKGIVCNCGNRPESVEPRKLAEYEGSARALIAALKNAIAATNEKRFPFKISLQFPDQLESEQAEEPNSSSAADLGLKKGKWDR